MSKIPAKIGKYPVEEKIAEGGMGAVFKGTHPTLEQPVVLKKLTLNNSEQLTERFRREAKIMIDFSHENIVRVYDHFKQASSYYIVQEFVDGCSVDILLKKERYLDINIALYIFYHACLALQYAHNRQVIHRDIKPANIMVSRNGEIKLVDFGIAQADSEEDALTKDGMTLGTPSYMAPEQFEDSRNVTCQADIYSLGVMLYEMLTGKKPFPGKINPETILKIQKGRYVPPKKLQPEIPGFVSSIVKSCMEAHLKKRSPSIAFILKKLNRWYQSAPLDDIRENLVSLITGEPREQKSGLYRSRKNRLKIIGILALVLILTGGSLFAYFKGVHYRYLLNRQYGGFQIQLQIDNPLKPGKDLKIKSSLFEDDNQSIPGIDSSIYYRIKEETENGVSLVSNTVYLKPGPYRIKTEIDNQVIWKNLYLEPMKTDKSLFDYGEVSHFSVSWTPYRSQPLHLDVKVSERSTGRDLTDAAEVLVLEKNTFLPVSDLKEIMMTGNVYKIRIAAEGYYPNDYHLKIQPYQTTLQLDARLVPVEGSVSFEGIQDGMKIRIDGNQMILSGGFPGEYLDLSRMEEKEPLSLNPGEHILSVEYKKQDKEIPFTMKREEKLKISIQMDDKEIRLEKVEE